LYGQIHEKGAVPNKEFLDEWYGKLIEVVDKYEPIMPLTKYRKTM